MLSILLFSIYAHSTPLEEGDRLWGQEQYHLAVDQWKLAREGEQLGEAVIARYRLLLVSNNILLAWDLISAERALQNCPTDEPYCILAHIDRELIFKTLLL